MSNTQVWTLPPSSADDYNHDLTDFTRPHAHCVYYVKSTIGALHKLDTPNKRVLQWNLRDAMTPPHAIKGEPPGASRIALTPGRAGPRVWAALSDWRALVELDPVANELRLFHATGTSGQPGYPLTTLSSVLPQSASRIWFSSYDYALDSAVVGLLDTVALRIDYWILGERAKDVQVRDLALDTAGRVWFACQANADEAEQVPFLGMLDPLTRGTRYWLASGVYHAWPDRRVGCTRLGARNRVAASEIWQVTRNHFGSSVARFDTTTLDAMEPGGHTNLNDGNFAIAVDANGRASICYEDFVRVYSGASTCVGPAVFATVSATARKESCAARVAAFDENPVACKVSRRVVTTNEAVTPCTSELTPANPSICDIIHGGSKRELWLGRSSGYEIALYKP
jgi:hypothetical protein